MRFRSRFAWLQLVGALIWMGIGLISFFKHLHDGNGQGYSFIAIIQVLIALSYFLMYFFTWWRIDDRGLTQHGFGGERTISWNEITHIGPWQPNDRPNYQWVSVQYSRPAPLSDRGELLIQPANRDTLVRSLRTHAPQADYEIFPQEI
jgi:hypothetical protein